MSAMSGKSLMNAADEAPEAGFAPVNYGRLTVEPMVKTFGKGNDKHAKPTLEPYRDGQKLEPNQVLVFKIRVGISELNPALTFEYERDVNIQKSGRNKTDWSEIVLPSLISTFGEDWGDAVLKQPYVEVEDVPNVTDAMTKSGKVLGVPKFIRVFKSKAECAKAREARFGNAAGSSSSASSGGDVPEGVVKQVRSLVEQVGKDAARAMLQGKPFGDYDAEDLLAAAE